MLLVILGIVIFGLGIWMSWVSNIGNSEGARFIGGAVLGAIGAAIFIMGLIAPMNGFNEPVIKQEANLMPIYVDDNTGESIYAIKASTGEYFVKYMVNNELVLTTIECDIIEDKSVEKPVKRVNEYDAKPSIWSLALVDVTKTVLVISDKNISK